MNPPPELENLLNSLDQYHAGLVRAQAATADPVLRQQLAAVADRLKQSQLQFAGEYQNVTDGLRQRLADAKRKADEARQTVAQAREKLAAAAAKPPEPPAAPEKPNGKVDPELGRQLRIELLERFGNHQPPGNAGKSSPRTAWEDGWNEWDGSEDDR